MPDRVQLSRRKGWRMPPNTVKVDRTTMWGNRGAAALGIKDRAAAVEYFESWMNETASWAWKGRAKIELRGKNLACWCPLDEPCHADVLLKFVNED
ncbi:MAG: DUF4326 domain-containing protein [Patescibacteria group bacterium]|nr:DUF4326 domain-containing protein [Patescibacteria group bacterium]